jgi:hypothetical protein
VATDERRPRAAFTSAHQRSNLNVNEEPRVQAADVRVDGSAGRGANGLLDPPPPRPPRPGARSRATLSPYKKFTTGDRSDAGAGRPKKYGKYFTGFLSVWQTRRCRLAAMIGLSKNPTICRGGSPTPASARQAWSCARIYCPVPQRFLPSAAGQGGRERDAQNTNASFVRSLTPGETTIRTRRRLERMRLRDG